MAFPVGVVAVVAALVGAGDGPLAPDWVPRLMAEEEAASGFFPLYDGRDLDGWTTRGPQKQAFVSRGNTLAVTGQGRLNWLLTTDAYENFVMRFAFRLPSASTQSVVGYGMSSDGAALEQAMVLTQAVLKKPLGEWNEAEVICDGGKIEMTVNGADFGSGSGCAGFIGIRDCGEPAEFRNIRIKPLPGGNGWRRLDSDPLPEKFELRFRFKPSAGSRGGVAIVSGAQTVFEICIDNHDMEAFTGSLAGTASAIELRSMEDCWNHMRIGVDGPNLQVWVNGKTVVDFVSTQTFSCAGTSAKFNAEIGSIEFEDIQVKAKE